MWIRLGTAQFGPKSRRRQINMENEFIFNIEVLPDWIDYNQHMQDAYYGLAFSYAVDHFQDCVGFDARYRSQSGCTIYVIEDHKFYLNEVKSGSELNIETNLIDTDKQKFVLYSQMFVRNELVAVSEMLQAHVSKNPKPAITNMPVKIYDRFKQLKAQLPVKRMKFHSRRILLIQNNHKKM